MNELHPDDFAFHVRLVSRRVNEQLGDDVTVDDLVRLMLDMGWQPPADARSVQLYREAFVRNASHD